MAKFKVKNKLVGIGDGAKSAAAYTFATLFSKGLAIITVPIFARIMTTEEIGTVNLFSSWYQIISIFATLSLTSGGYIVALKEYENSKDQYQSSVLTLTSLIAIVLAGVFFACPSFWTKITGLSTPLIILMLIGFLFAPARDFWLARQRYEYKYKLPTIVIIVSAVVASIASVVVVLDMRSIGSENVAEGRLFANYIVLFLVAAVIWISTMVKGRDFFNMKYWKFSLSLSIPLVGYSVATQILGVSDRVMISHMVNNSAVGIYGTLYTVSSLSIMVWQALHASFVPYLFKNIDNPTSKIKKTSNALVIFYALVAIALTYFAPEIVSILATDEYMEAIYIMPPIAAGIFLTCLTNLYSDIPVYYKKTKYVMFPAVIAAVLNVVLNYIFIGIYGYMAAAYTTLFSYMVWTVLQAVFAKNICKKQNINAIFDDKKLLVISIATMAMCLMGIFLYQNNIVRYIAGIITLISGCVLAFRLKKRGVL